MVTVRLVVVLAISETPLKNVGEVEDCQRTTLPVCPLRVKVVELVPEHLEALPATVPPTDTAVTVMVPVALTEPHPPVRGML